MDNQTLDASTNKLLAELVDRVLDELQRRGPATEFVTGEWLDSTSGVIDEAIAEVMKLVINVPPAFKQDLEKILREVVWSSWRKMDKDFRPKAWVEKFWAAEADEDRNRIFYSALKYICLEKKREKREAEKRFVSLDALEDQALKAADGGPAPQETLPSATDNQDAGLVKEKLHEALLTLPIQLAVIAYLLPGANGNASNLARRMGIPQKQMSRHLAKIRKQFRRHGLEA
jgi:hypothetical protein